MYILHPDYTIIILVSSIDKNRDFYDFRENRENRRKSSKMQEMQEMQERLK